MIQTSVVQGSTLENCLFKVKKTGNVFCEDGK